MWDYTRWGSWGQTSLHTGTGGRSVTRFQTRGGERSEPSVCPRNLVPEPPLSLCVRQSKVSMTITASGVTGATISIVNSQSIRVALSSLLDSSINRNWEVRLMKSLEAPFRSSRSRAMFWSCKFTNSAQPQQHETELNINNNLYYRMNYKNLTANLFRLSLPFNYWHIHNKLIKSQSSHKATRFRGQLFQLPDIFRPFDFFFGGSLTALVLFSFNRRLLHKRFAGKKCFCYVIQRQTTFSAHNNAPSQRNCKLLCRINNNWAIISNMAVKLTRNEHDYCLGNIWLTSTKT